MAHHSLDRFPLEVFSGKRVLITGHTGFCGSWLSLWLSELGANIFGYSCPPPTSPSHYHSSQVSKRIAKEWISDIRDLQKLRDCWIEADADVIFHLAAQSIVRIGYEDPRLTMETNFIGTLNLLELVRKSNKPCALVVVTSDKCYDLSAVTGSLSEGAPLGGRDPYSASKGATEILVSSYRHSYFADFSSVPRVQLATVRAGNIIGGGDWASDRLIPDVVRAVMANTPLKLRNPMGVRPWQHVCDALWGYLILAAAMLSAPSRAWCQAWNLGPGMDQCITVQEIVHFIIKEWGREPLGVGVSTQKYVESETLRLDASKAISKLGWHPKWNIYESLKHTVRWYQDFEEGGDLINSSLRDIKEHQGAR